MLSDDDDDDDDDDDVLTTSIKSRRPSVHKRIVTPLFFCDNFIVSTQLFQTNIVVLVWPGAAHVLITVKVSPVVYSVQQWCVCVQNFIQIG